MRHLPVAMACVAILVACTNFPRPVSPTDTDIATLETTRVLEPLVGITPSGQRYVEFAPSVEIRGVACVPDDNAFVCSYESRMKGFWANKWQPWTNRTMRVTWDGRTGCWIDSDQT